MTAIKQRIKSRSALALIAAFAFTLFASINTTYAQTNFGQEVSIPNSALNSASGAVVSAPLTPTAALSIESGAVSLGDGAAADASEMALVSLEAREVQLAKTATGAQQVASQLVSTTYHWSSAQMTCLNTLWNRESHWNFQAHNYSSGASGIPQAMPATKMSEIASDWRTNPVTQIKWGIRYIYLRYGTPCKALAHESWHGSY
jgi:hypothetical protein